VTVFVDTSALLAILDADDVHHVRARSDWGRLLEGPQRRFTSNYVLVETYALVRSRLGMPALHALVEDLIPVLDVLWLDAELHEQASAALLAAGRRRLSLVDCASFVLMRRHGIQRAFAFDRHFAEQGFERA
jgi:predicted nucleic acid-binding protein